MNFVRKEIWKDVFGLNDSGNTVVHSVCGGWHHGGTCVCGWGRDSVLRDSIRRVTVWSMKGGRIQVRERRYVVWGGKWIPMAHYWDPATRSKALEPVERKACLI